MTAWRDIPAQEGLEHGDQLADILGGEDAVDTLVGNTVERRLVEFLHDNAAVLRDIVLQQIHEANLLGGEAGVGVEEALEMLLDGLRIQANDLAHGKVQLIRGTAVELVEHFQADARMAGEDGRGERLQFWLGNRLALVDFLQGWIGGQHAVKKSLRRRR